MAVIAGVATFQGVFRAVAGQEVGVTFRCSLARTVEETRVDANLLGRGPLLFGDDRLEVRGHSGPGPVGLADAERAHAREHEVRAHVEAGPAAGATCVELRVVIAGLVDPVDIESTRGGRRGCTARSPCSARRLRGRCPREHHLPHDLPEATGCPMPLGAAPCTPAPGVSCRGGSSRAAPATRASCSRPPPPARRRSPATTRTRPSRQ